MGSAQTPRVAVVAAGAGARGAFEAGALSVVVPWLADHGMRPTIFVGTSAGAINATVMAATADLPATQSAEVMLDFWRSLTLRRVFRSPVLSGPATLAASIGQMFGRGHVTSLLDTSPLAAFAEGWFARVAPALRDNMASGRVEALAVVATAAGQRTIVFTDVAPGREPPCPNRGRAIDYQATEVDVRHVLASAAIPMLFPPVRVDRAFYTDGGLRLNAPIAPAVALGATHVVVVATHPGTYGAAPRRQRPMREPDVVDSLVAVMNSLLADRMVEDLHTLDLLNTRAGGDVRLIPRLFIGPSTRHEIGALAARVYAERYRGRRVVRECDFRLLHRLIGPHEEGGGDLLSYLFFDTAFTEAAIRLGARYAREQLSRGARVWEPAGQPRRRRSERVPAARVRAVGRPTARTAASAAIETGGLGLARP